jgi:hypothetical protein
VKEALSTPVLMLAVTNVSCALSLGCRSRHVTKEVRT